MKTEKKTGISQIITIAGAYLAFVIGSSFASGQECLQYFSGHGLWRSIGAVIIALLIYVWFAPTIIEDGRKLNLKSSGKIYQFYLGKYLGKIMEWYTPLMLFFLYSLMISGVGATFEEYYGMNGNIGRFLMIAASLITVLMGLDNLVNIVGHIAPVLLIATMMIGILSIVHNPAGIAEADEVLKTVEVQTTFDNWIVSGIMFDAFTVAGIVPYLASVGKSASSGRKYSLLGGSIGCISFMTAILILNLGLLANIGNVYNLEIPSFYVAAQIHPVFGKLFAVMLLLGIYTTAAPMLFAVCNKISSDSKSKAYRITAVFTGIISIFGGQLSFSIMINILYPISGYMGIVIFVGMIYTKYIKRKKHSDFREEN